MILRAQTARFAPLPTRPSCGSGCLPPVITSLSFEPQPVFARIPATTRLSYSDPGLADIHTATINWGEGEVRYMQVDDLRDLAAAVHINTNEGEYTLRVRVTDSDGALAEYEQLVTVRMPSLHLSLMAR